MPYRDRRTYRDYIRRYMRLRGLYARTTCRFQPHMDEHGSVPVRVIENFALWGQQFVPGTRYSMHWRLAARLEAAGLVELVRPRRLQRAVST